MLRIALGEKEVRGLLFSFCKWDKRDSRFSKLTKSIARKWPNQDLIFQILWFLVAIASLTRKMHESLLRARNDHFIARERYSPGKNTGVGSLVIFPIQGSNPGLLHYRQILYLMSHQGSPEKGNVPPKRFISPLLILKHQVYSKPSQTDL